MDRGDISQLSRRLDYVHDALAKLAALGVASGVGWGIHTQFEPWWLPYLGGFIAYIAVFWWSCRFWRRMGGEDF